jgi:hypothetical protein
MPKQNKVISAEFRRNSFQAWIEIVISDGAEVCIYPSQKRTDSLKLSLWELRETEAILAHTIGKQMVDELVPDFVTLLKELREIIKAREKELILC